MNLQRLWGFSLRGVMISGRSGGAAKVVVVRVASRIHAEGLCGARFSLWFSHHGWGIPISSSTTWCQACFWSYIPKGGLSAFLKILREVQYLLIIFILPISFKVDTVAFPWEPWMIPKLVTGMVASNWLSRKWRSLECFICSGWGWRLWKPKWVLRPGLLQLMTHSCKTVVNHMISGENTEKLCQVTDLLKSENVEVQFCCCCC